MNYTRFIIGIALALLITMPSAGKQVQQAGPAGRKPGDCQDNTNLGTAGL